MHRALLLLALAAASPASAGPPGWLPPRMVFQVAGQLGLVAAGPGWELGDAHVRIDVLAGWAPARLTGVEIFTISEKLSWAPWRLAGARGFRLEPAVLSFQLTYAFGDAYFVRSPARYPEAYYQVPTALHSGVGLGACAWWRPPRGGPEVGLYAEAVALGAMVALWRENPRTLGLDDVVSLAFGLAVRP